jgi:hypothetical protein
LCRALEITPNELFGSNSKADGEVVRLKSWTARTVLKFDEASPAMRRAIDAMPNTAPKHSTD